MIAFYFALAFAGEPLDQLREGEPHADHAAWTVYRMHYDLPIEAARHRVEHLNWRGRRLVSQRFLPKGPSAGTVHIIHGYLDHTGLQSPLVRAINDAGFEARSIDLPGHGLSQGPRGQINAMAHYTEVLALWLDGAERPLRLVAHSMGGAITMEAMNLGVIGPKDRIVLIAPLVRWSSWWLTGVAQQAVGWMLNSLPRRVRRTSHDEAFVLLRRDDPLRIRRIPLNWTRAMRFWANRFSQTTELPHRPIILQGRGDTIIDWRANHLLIQQVFPLAQFHFFKRARHHLQAEAPRIRKKVLRMVVEGLAGDP
jgi:alpha-beta hydrolase superfamily lysophospholipase